MHTHRPFYCPDNIQNLFSSNLALDCSQAISLLIGLGMSKFPCNQILAQIFGDIYRVTLNTQAKQDMYIIRMTAMKRMSRMAVVPNADSMVIWTGMWWTPLEPSADKIVLVMLKS